MERFPSSWVVFALHAIHADPTHRTVLQRGDDILHDFRHFRQDVGFVGQIDAAVFSGGTSWSDALNRLSKQPIALCMLSEPLL